MLSWENRCHLYEQAKNKSWWLAAFAAAEDCGLTESLSTSIPVRKSLSDGYLFLFILHRGLQAGVFLSVSFKSCFLISNKIVYKFQTKNTLFLVGRERNQFNIVEKARAR